MAVIFVAEEQDDKQSILSNSGGSEPYEDFVSGMKSNLPCVIKVLIKTETNL